MGCASSRDLAGNTNTSISLVDEKQIKAIPCGKEKLPASILNTGIVNSCISNIDIPSQRIFIPDKEGMNQRGMLVPGMSVPGQLTEATYVIDVREKKLNATIPQQSSISSVPIISPALGSSLTTTTHDSLSEASLPDNTSSMSPCMSSSNSTITIHYAFENKGRASITRLKRQQP